MNKRTPTPQLVMAVLREADDYLTMAMIAERMHVDLRADRGLWYRRISAALYSLLQYHAVDYVEGDAALWWFALPPEEDRRLFRYTAITADITRARRPGHAHPRNRVPRRPR